MDSQIPIKPDGGYTARAVTQLAGLPAGRAVKTNTLPFGFAKIKENHQI